MIAESNFIDELKNQNPKAIDYVMDTYGNLIYRIAYMYLDSKELSEECLNDVLLKIWRGIDKYKYPKDKFKNWIVTITKYSSIDILRKEKKNLTNLDDESLTYIPSNEDLQENNISKIELELIKENINKFKEIDRNIFIQRFFKDMDIKDISKMYNISENAINIRILRARKKLLQSLNYEEGKL